MKSRDLSCVINRYLFIPIGDDLVENLHVVAVSMAAELTVENVAPYVEAVFHNKPYFKFVNQFRSKYEETFDNKLSLPAIVYIVLLVYVLRMALQVKELSEDTKIKISLVVRNYSVLKKGNWGGLHCQEWLKDLYAYYESHSCKTVGPVGYTDLLNAVVPKIQWSETGMAIDKKEVYDQLRSLCAAGIRGKANSYVESTAFKNLSSPFAKVYMLAYHMAYEWNWKYISKSPVNKMAEVLGEDRKRKKKLSKIVDEVIEEITADNVLIPDASSSVLLKRIFDRTPCAADGYMFSALEFGVYLYYEMLLLSINN